MSVFSDGAYDGAARASAAAGLPATSGDALIRLLPCLDHLGITRIGDITGLDTIGIPVVQAVRPLGLANAVTQGKGINVAAAAVSAVLEAAEQFFAERLAAFHPIMASAACLGVSPEQFALHVLPDVAADWAERETAWIEGVDLMTARPAWLPFEMVHTAFVDPPLATDGLFAASTTGLASGFDEHHALLHGILECVEHDAIARAQRTHGFFQKFRLDVSGSGDSVLDDLVRRVRNAGLLCAFWLVPAAAEIPVVWCQIMEDGSQSLITPYPADGFAADLNVASAAGRALIEAAQSRVAAISGSRDDITRASYPLYVDWPAIEAHRRLLAKGPMLLHVASFDEQGGPAPIDPLENVVDRLAEACAGPVHYVSLDTTPLQQLHAIRAVMPLLWPLSE